MSGIATQSAEEKEHYRIGEVSRMTELKPFVLRYWETEFPMLEPVKSSSGHRLYRREDVDIVLKIKRRRPPPPPRSQRRCGHAKRGPYRRLPTHQSRNAQSRHQPRPAPQPQNAVRFARFPPHFLDASGTPVIALKSWAEPPASVV